MSMSTSHRCAIALSVVFALCGCAKNDGDEARVGTRPGRADGLSILPIKAHANHVLKAGGIVFAAQFSDSDTASPGAESTLRWLVNGTEVGRGFELQPGTFRRGDVVELQRLAMPMSPDAAPQVLERDQIVILNSSPHITGVVLDRSRENGAYLECRVSAVDSDEDPLQATYEWLLDGQRMPGAMGELAAVHDLPKGSRVEVRVVVSDGKDKSAPFQSRSYVIDNLPPRLQVPAQAGVAVQPDGTRKVSFTVTAQDPDGDKVTISFSGAPSDAQYDPASGLVSWIVTGPANETVIMVRADDGKGAVVEHELRIAGEPDPAR
jgi:hypothetical protein